MSTSYLRQAIADGDDEKIIRFVRLHLGDGSEKVGRREIDKSWVEATKVLVDYEPIDRDAIEKTLALDDATLASLFFQLHFHLIKRTDGWIHEGSR